MQNKGVCSCMMFWCLLSNPALAFLAKCASSTVTDFEGYWRTGEDDVKLITLVQCYPGIREEAVWSLQVESLLLLITVQFHPDRWSHLCSCSHLEYPFEAHLYRYRKELLLWEGICFMQCTFQYEPFQVVCSVSWIRTWESWTVLRSAKASWGKQHIAEELCFFT